MSSRLCAAAAFFAAAACGGAKATEPGPPPTPSCTFTNPVAGSGQDPWVTRSNGFYYLIESGASGITVYKSATLTSPKQNGVLIWSRPSAGWNSANVWAPELHFIDGKWYVYYAAGLSSDPGGFTRQRAGVLESNSADPQGSYTDRGMLYTGDSISTVTGGVESASGNRWAIDLTVHRIGTDLYAVWSGWRFNASTDRTPQHLYIARMSNPYTVATNRAKISSPDRTWEDGAELDLQEGPEFLERNGKVFIVYSTRESWLPAYQMGELRLDNAAAPMDSLSYTKLGPVFSGTATVFGVGHASFTKSPDGSEDWIVYHSKKSTTPGWDRDIRAQKFTWNADGSPNFGTPVAAGVAVAKPAGECTQ